MMPFEAVVLVWLYYFILLAGCELIAVYVRRMAILLMLRVLGRDEERVGPSSFFSFRWISK